MRRDMQDGERWALVESISAHVRIYASDNDRAWQSHGLVAPETGAYPCRRFIGVTRIRRDTMFCYPPGPFGIAKRTLTQADGDLRLCKV